MVGMEIKSNLKQLLGKQMSRQEFLKHVAIGAVALIGGGALVRLAGLGGSSAHDATYGGGGAYGGDPSRRGRAA